MKRPLHVVLFGATGLVGRGVLRACLDDDRVHRVTAIVRRPLDVTHPKLKAVEHRDFLDLKALRDRFNDVGAVFFAIGVSVRDVEGEQAYRTITHDYAMEAARAVRAESPSAVFHFVSGGGSKLDSRWMWARVKAETERDLKNTGLAGVVSYRPALVVGVRGQKASYKVEAALRKIEFLYRASTSFSVRSVEIGQAMIQATVEGLKDAVLENRDVREMATRSREAVTGTPHR